MAVTRVGEQRGLGLEFLEQRRRRRLGSVLEQRQSRGRNVDGAGVGYGCDWKQYWCSCLE